MNTYIILSYPTGRLGAYKTDFMLADSQDEAIKILIKSRGPLDRMIIIDLADAYEVPIEAFSQNA
jgi:hypothetical protein